MRKIRNVNEVNGILYKNDFMNNMISDSLQNMAGIKTFKVYRLSDHEFNIVLMIDKNLNALNVLDNSLEKMECLLKDDFRFQNIFVNIYILEK